MAILAVFSAMGASLGWACGSMLAHEQLLTSGAVLCLFSSVLGYWQSVDWSQWPAFVVSIFVSVLVGNLAMMECLHRAGPRQTELLLSLKTPIVAVLAFIFLGETLSAVEVTGILVASFGICLAIMYSLRHIN